MKMLPFILFENKLTFSRWKWPAEGTGTVAIVPAQFFSFRRELSQVPGLDIETPNAWSGYSPGWPFPVLKYKYSLQIKYTEVTFVKPCSETAVV